MKEKIPVGPKLVIAHSTREIELSETKTFGLPAKGIITFAKSLEVLTHSIVLLKGRTEMVTRDNKQSINPRDISAEVKRARAQGIRLRRRMSCNECRAKLARCRHRTTSLVLNAA